MRPSRILGCDTTFKVFGFGKDAVLKKYTNCVEFENVASVFNQE
jgi:hypothetical protein